MRRNSLEEEFARSDMLNFIQHVMSNLTGATLFENPGDWTFVGKLSLLPVSKVKATCVTEVKTNWMTVPPTIYCSDPWVRRERDWHAGPKGILCYVLDNEWRDKIRDLATRHDAKGIASYASEYLIRNTRWLLQRHMIGHQQNLAEWSWGGWGHGPVGPAEYAAEQKLLKRNRIKMSTIPTRFRGKAGRIRLLEVLKSLKIAKNNEAIARELLEVATPMTFGDAKGHSTLITQGEMSTEIYFLLSGAVSVRIKRREVAIRRAGDHVGEMALIDPIHPRSASIIATERTEVARVSQQDFLRIADNHTEVWKQLSIELGNRLRQRGNSIPKPNKVPVVFIGSAKKQIPVMDALSRAIESRLIKVKRWSKGIFGSSLTTIETLESVIGTADFVVVILSADDRIFIDDKIVETPRDNCVFELGMGMGALGRHRTLFLKENKGLHLPSDLDGITYYPYDLQPRKTFEQHIKEAAREIKARVNSLQTK